MGGGVSDAEVWREMGAALGRDFARAATQLQEDLRRAWAPLLAPAEESPEEIVARAIREAQAARR